MINYEIIKKNRESDPEAYEAAREGLIVALIRERYTIDQELAILRQRDSKRDLYEQYDGYVEECKTKVNQMLR